MLQRARVYVRRELLQRHVREQHLLPGESSVRLHVLRGRLDLHRSQLGHLQRVLRRPGLVRAVRRTQRAASLLRRGIGLLDDRVLRPRRAGLQPF